MGRKPKIYLASPFFNPTQVAFVEKLEQLIIEENFELFSPRKGRNALMMNQLIKERIAWEQDRQKLVEKVPEPPQPSKELRFHVFKDNWWNIDEADLMVAVIDDRDVGVMWEIGYAYAKSVPIISTTQYDYGCNLMLAHSLIGHTKSLDDLRGALKLMQPFLRIESRTEDYGKAIGEVSYRFKADFALKEGPNERIQE